MSHPVFIVVPTHVNAAVLVVGQAVLREDRFHGEGYVAPLLGAKLR